MLEDYLKQEELSQELKKEKLRKKRCRKREKKKIKKNGNFSTNTDIDEDLQGSEADNQIYKLNRSENKPRRHILDEIPEKEREFLINMGWGEDDYEEDEGGCEINVMRSELEKEREVFRRGINEKFMKLIQKS